MAWATDHAHVAPRRDPPAAALRRLTRDAFLSLAGSLTRFGEKRFVRCLYGHWVFDDQVEEFRAVLRRLQEVGTFVSTERVVQMLRGEAPVDGRYFHLSFDDGFDNIYRNALPVAVELEVPAAVFVPTRFIGASDAEVVRDWWRREQVPRPTRPLRWAWLEEMARLGFDIGSHTRHHRRLSQVADRRELADEIVGSKRDLEDRLGLACRFFAWPWGGHSDIDERGMELIEEAGYEASFSAVRGSVSPERTPRFSIPRHHFEPEWPWAHVRFFAAGGHEQV